MIIWKIVELMDWLNKLKRRMGKMVIFKTLEFGDETGAIATASFFWFERYIVYVAWSSYEGDSTENVVESHRLHAIWIRILIFGQIAGFFISFDSKRRCVSHFPFQKTNFPSLFLFPDALINQNIQNQSQIKETKVPNRREKHEIMLRDHWWCYNSELKEVLSLHSERNKG